MENPNAGINIALTSSDVVSYKAYTVTDTSEEELTSDDITIGEDYFSGKRYLMYGLEVVVVCQYPLSLFFL